MAADEAARAKPETPEAAAEARRGGSPSRNGRMEGRRQQTAEDESGRAERATGIGAQSHAKGATWEDMVNVTGAKSVPPSVLAAEEAAAVRRGSPSRMQRLEARRQQMAEEEAARAKA